MKDDGVRPKIKDKQKDKQKLKDVKIFNPSNYVNYFTLFYKSDRGKWERKIKR